MKIPWTTLVVLAFCAMTAKIPSPLYGSPPAEPVVRNSVLSKELFRQRLAEIDIPFNVQYTERVHDDIVEYLTRGYRQTQYLLGRSTLYFPIFEHYLTVHNLPMELKYLPMVESALRPGVQSQVGAAGLWQFMDFTAQYYGLNITEYVDERKDPILSTQAAVKMLADLYEEYQDWSLVLAAYNAGPARVNKAIRQVPGASDFWAVQELLPEETQRYVPAFIAAAYVANFYDVHNIQPAFPDFELQDTRVISIRNYLTFRQIEEVTGVSRETLRKLNPGYQKQIIPQNASGYFLVLPSHAMPKFREFWNKKLNPEAAKPENIFQTTYVVTSGDSLRKLAEVFHCTPEAIIRWNQLSGPELVINQELVIYLSREFMITKV